MRLILLALLISGCATKSDEFYWDKPGTTQASFEQDQGQCDAQAFSVAGGNLLQIALVYDGCMRGKGYRKVAKQ